MPRATASTSESFRFDGVTSPNTTQVPDQYLDELLPILTGAELKVLLYITRRTFGFKKAADNISLSQMLNGIRTRDGRQLDAGVGLSKKTLLGAIRSLEEQNIILTQRRRSAERGDEPTSYQLNIRSIPVSHDQVAPVGEKLHQGGGDKTSPRPWSRNSPTQQTVSQQTENNISNDSKKRSLAVEDENRQKFDEQRTGIFEQSVDETSKHDESSPLKGLVAKRAPKRSVDSDDKAAIKVVVEQFASEMGDRAPLSSSLSRAMNLFADSGLSRDGFIGLLFEARAATREMGNSPDHRPTNRMAYFFGVAEDLLGVKEAKV